MARLSCDLATWSRRSYPKGLEVAGKALRVTSTTGGYAVKPQRLACRVTLVHDWASDPSVTFLGNKSMSSLEQSRYQQKARARAVVSVETYRDDPLYPRIVGAVRAILARGKVVAPVDVLVGMGLLDPTLLDAWRFGQVPYLERVINCNLMALSRLLRILRFHAHDLKLVPSDTAYVRWGKGHKQVLRFTKTGDKKLEQAYCRHFIWPGKCEFHPPAPRSETVQNDSSSEEGGPTS